MRQSAVQGHRAHAASGAGGAPRACSGCNRGPAGSTRGTGGPGGERRGRENSPRRRKAAACGAAGRQRWRPGGCRHGAARQRHPRHVLPGNVHKALADVVKIVEQPVAQLDASAGKQAGAAAAPPANGLLGTPCRKRAGYTLATRGTVLASCHQRPSWHAIWGAVVPLCADATLC